MVPKIRAECVDGPRPCPHTTCRHHLAMEIKPWRRTEQDESCALDVADRGPHTLEMVAQVLHVTRERIRQMEADALTRVRLRRLPMFCMETAEHYGVGVRKNLHVLST